MLRAQRGYTKIWLILLTGCDSTTHPVQLWQLQLVGGGDQVGGAGTTLERPVTVALLDSDDRAIAHADVHWRIVQGGGAANAPLTRTDSSGRASIRWTLGADVGTHLLLVEAGNAALTIRATSEFRIMRITAGFRHTCALATSGTLFCWGANTSGQLGDGSGVSSARPVRVTSAVGFRDVGAGWFHTCGVTHFDQMFCWGDNSHGQLGIGPPGPYQSRPVRVTTIPSAVQMSGGYLHTCAVQESRSLDCWGDDERGRLAAGAGVASVAAGEFHTCAVRQDHQLLCWGWNSLGEIGIDAALGAVIIAPTSVSDTLRFNAVAASARHTCGVSTGQRAYCWGRSAVGEIGQEPYAHTAVPTAVEGVVGFTGITTGNTHTCGVAAALAYCWGAWLGNGSASPSRRPAVVSGLSTVTDIAAGFDHTCAVARGEAWCWGSNLHGQLGRENLQQSLVPIRVSFP